jgi:hypothetical protein
MLSRAPRKREKCKRKQISGKRRSRRIPLAQLLALNPCPSVSLPLPKTKKSRKNKKRTAPVVMHAKLPLVPSFIIEKGRTGTTYSSSKRQISFLPSSKAS